MEVSGNQGDSGNHPDLKRRLLGAEFRKNGCKK